MKLQGVTIVGAGLIGASVGLALREGDVHVTITDRDEARLRLAADLGAGEPVGYQHLGSARPADVALLCTPPEAVAGELKRVQGMGLASTYSDVSSIKAQPQSDAQRLGAEMSTFVGGHPIAGRERSGPGNARADLFLGRPWVLTPTDATVPDALDAVTHLAETCGAEVLVRTADQHDEVVALVSHLPQALASALAAELLAASADASVVAGQGFRDMTRIADSDPHLWGQIAAGNAGPLARLLKGVGAQMTDLAEALSVGDARAAEAFAALVARGNAGR